MIYSDANNPDKLETHPCERWPICGANLAIPEYKEEEDCTILGPKLHISPVYCKLAIIFMGDYLQ